MPCGDNMTISRIGEFQQRGFRRLGIWLSTQRRKCHFETPISAA
jgi:hypothetical protein